MASYDPKRSRPATDVDAGPSPIDALLDGDRAAAPAVVTDDGVVDLRGDSQHSPDVPHIAPEADRTVAEGASGGVPTIVSTIGGSGGRSDAHRSPIVAVPGPDHRSRRLLTTVIAVASALGILAIARAIQRSRRA